MTLATEGRHVKCHKVVLSASSPYFRSLLAANPTNHPIIILRDVSWLDLRYIVEYMYRGEINVGQRELSSLLRSAETLQIRGLVEFGAKLSRGEDKGGDLMGGDGGPLVIATDEEGVVKHEVEIKPAKASGPTLNLDSRNNNNSSKRKRHASQVEPGQPNASSPPTLKIRPNLTTDTPTSSSPLVTPGSLSITAFGQQQNIHQPDHRPGSSTSMSPPSLTTPLGSTLPASFPVPPPAGKLDDLSDVKPGIMELIQEEQRVSSNFYRAFKSS